LLSLVVVLEVLILAAVLVLVDLEQILILVFHLELIILSQLVEVGQALAVVRLELLVVIPHFHQSHLLVVVVVVQPMVLL
jgi:hypothetical protein